MGSPKVVTDAFVPDLRRLPGGLVLRPLSIAHTLLLQKIESPFLAVDGDSSAPPARKSRAGAAETARQELATLAVVFLLTRAEPEIDALFYEFDRAEFDRQVWQFAKSQPPALLIGLREKLTAIFAQSTSTMIGGGSGQEEAADDQKKTT